MIPLSNASLVYADTVDPEVFAFYCFARKTTQSYCSLQWLIPISVAGSQSENGLQCLVYVFAESKLIPIQIYRASGRLFSPDVRYRNICRALGHGKDVEPTPYRASICSLKCDKPELSCVMVKQCVEVRTGRSHIGDKSLSFSPSRAYYCLRLKLVGHRMSRRRRCTVS
jgi:hypothetical protein